MAKAQATGRVPLGVHSEVGTLRKVMVCSPGLAHTRLTPTNCDDLLFDDVLWVDNAKRDHFDFVTKMRDRGVDVLEMHNLLTETLDNPAAKTWILDQQIVPNEVGLELLQETPLVPRRPAVAQARRASDRRPLDARGPRHLRQRGAEACRGQHRDARVHPTATAQHALHA